MMMDVEQYVEMKTALATLIAGQQTTNAHLERLNSKVATHEGDINNLKLWKERAAGVGDATKIAWATVTMVISGGFALCVYFLKQ